MSSDERRPHHRATMPTTASTGHLIIFRLGTTSKVCPHYVDLKNQLLYIQQRFHIKENYMDIKLSIEQNLLDSDFDAESWKYVGQLSISADRNAEITLPVVKISIKESNEDVTPDSGVNSNANARARANVNTRLQNRQRSPESPLQNEESVRADKSSASSGDHGDWYTDGSREDLDVGYRSSFEVTIGGKQYTIRAGKRAPKRCDMCRAGKTQCHLQESKHARSCYECRRDKEFCGFKYRERKKYWNGSDSSVDSSDNSEASVLGQIGD